MQHLTAVPGDSQATLAWEQIGDAESYTVKYGTESGKYTETVTIAWYDAKDAGRGASFFAINKHDNNKGPFSSRLDYMLFDRILTFEVSEYSK